MQHHNYTLSDIENMMPWERDLYVTLVADHVQKENEKLKEVNR
tara:strand:- start:272 stop:400 length:129 start_codon:yes stop_codon:yes gene_type:complete